MQCPKCKVDRAHRAHRRGAKEYAASVFGCYPYRCHECEHRFLQWRTTAVEPEDKPAPPGKRAGAARSARAARSHVAATQRRREMLLYGLALLVFLAFLYYITRDRGPQGG